MDTAAHKVRIVKGFRTLASAAAFIATGLLSMFGALDLTPLVALFVKNPLYLPAAMVGVGALFGFLRLISTTPVFSAVPAPEVDEAPPAKVVDAGE